MHHQPGTSSQSNHHMCAHGMLAYQPLPPRWRRSHNIRTPCPNLTSHPHPHAGYRCLVTDTNPNYGYTSFDNFGSTSLSIFQMLTLDAWGETLLYPLSRAMGPGVPTAFFMLLVLLGSFFAMQLLIAILSSKFAQLDAEVGDGSTWSSVAAAFTTGCMGLSKFVVVHACNGLGSVLVPCPC